MKRWSAWLVLPAMIVLSSCQPPARNTDAEDERNPYFKRAASAVEARDYVAAAKEYEEALQINPSVATAHYELGLIYSEKLGNYISAMYHFQKFIQMRPDSSRRDTAQQRLEFAKTGFAATLPNSPIRDAEVLAKLQEENRQLVQNIDATAARIGTLEQQLTAARQTAVSVPVPPTAELPPPVVPATPLPAAVAPSAIPPSSPAPVTAASQGEPVRYTIQAGDNLWKIAAKFFPKNRALGVEKIKQANPDTASDPRKLKPGTVLIIPR